MFEPDMKPLERKLIILLLVFIVCSLAFITYRNLQAHTRHVELLPSWADAITAVRNIGCEHHLHCEKAIV
jgi:hypothetical protein